MATDTIDENSEAVLMVANIDCRLLANCVNELVRFSDIMAASLLAIEVAIGGRLLQW
jgi:hypothetical protein